MIVWLASYPRSGNTFFRMLLYHRLGYPTYSIYDDPVLENLGAADVLGQRKLERPLSDLRDEEATFFIKTHDLKGNLDVGDQAVYLVRDGRDALVSYSHYQIKLARKGGLKDKLRERMGHYDFERVLRRTVEIADGSESWSAHVNDWLAREPVPFVVRYEELVADPEKAMTGLRARFSLPLPQALSEPPSFAELHAKWPQFFRKGKTGAWKAEMPEDVHERFWQMHGSAMEKLGYER